MTNPVKLKTCKNKGCRVKFQQFNSIQNWCSPKCGQEMAAAKVKKNYKAETARLKKDYYDNDRSHQLKKAQDTFNKYIRMRDAHLPSISDDAITGQMHAGHYLSVGAHPELRFHPFNCHKQSASDNKWRSGNQVKYRINLIKKIGLENVEWLEGPHRPQNLTMEDIKGVTWWYKLKLKILQEEDREEIDLPFQQRQLCLPN